MQLNEHNVTSDSNDLIQLPLWPDDELPEVQQSAQDESQDVPEEASSPAQGEPSATQLHLPGFEPE